ncbi:hypothetical protein CDL15_Pgr007616 [Punica granatum]|uniref:Hexosyltransferase n=1 Tax=Punica granatum TaxID=22663 RepID=A0A218X9W9_PUNGR|nr:hypothetical protein CDL15_Pgr007616 [Punica granatum]
MKGGGAGGGKRRWRGLVIAVLCLVILSMLVPLGFLFGRFHTASTAGNSISFSVLPLVQSRSLLSLSVHHVAMLYSVFGSDQQSSEPNGLSSFDKQGISGVRDQSKSKKDQSETDHVKELVDKFPATIPEDVLKNISVEVKNHSISAVVKDDHPKKAFPVSPPGVLRPVSSSNVSEASHPIETDRSNRGPISNSDRLCELRFGSYCLWRREHREAIKDKMVKKLKDRLFVARAYFPSIAKLPDQEKLSRELRLNILEFERIFSISSRDVDLPPQIEQKLQRMEAAIAKSQSVKLDCNNVVKKLAQILDLTEDEANFHAKQSAFLYQLAVHTMPKSLHCLSMRLTVEYSTSPPPDMESSLANKFSDPSLHHFAIFSNNVLASSVVINSTVMNSKESQNLVFHVLTDEENYFAMKFWFFTHDYKSAAVQVLNVGQLGMDFQDKAALLSFSLSEEFRVTFHSSNKQSEPAMRTEYISIFSSLHYLLPEIFQNLGKIMVLDDDIVVQQDLSALWNLDMEGKVNGAQQFCSVRLGQLQGYLGENSLDKNSCVWMSGLNVIDLKRWRELQLTETYLRLAQELNMGETSAEAVSLRASFLTFQDLIKPLDESWVLSGLGHDFGVKRRAVNNAAVLHYNGNMKPWLEMGIPKYKRSWKRANHHIEIYVLNGETADHFIHSPLNNVGLHRKDFLGGDCMPSNGEFRLKGDSIVCM